MVGGVRSGIHAAITPPPIRAASRSTPDGSTRTIRAEVPISSVSSDPPMSLLAASLTRAFPKAMPMRSTMNKKLALKSLLAACLLPMVTACVAGNTMALNPELEDLDISVESIALLTLETENGLAPSYHPDVTSVRIRTTPVAPPEPTDEAEDSTSRYDAKRQASKQANMESKWYDALSAKRTPSGSYLLSFQLPPGRHEVTNIRGTSTALLIRGNFNFPIGVNFEIGPNEIAYIGHVKMVTRKREGGEHRAGSIFPLIDQAATGFASSTFDVTLTDQSANDHSSFEQAYPVLAGHSVATRMGDRSATEDVNVAER